MKAKALKEQTTAARPIKALMVYPLNTPATLVPRHDEIERKNLLITNDNLIADFLSKDVFYTATDFVLTVSRFPNMHKAFNAAQKRIAKLESKNSNLKNKIQNDDHDKHSDADPIHDLKALDSHNKELHAKVNALYDLNERWRVENKKVKRHYKELYDSIKITHAKTIKKTNSLLTEVPNLKAQIKENHKSNCVTMPAVKSKVLAPHLYVIDVEPIPPRNRNNREVHLDYLKHLKESVTTLREIVEEARVEKPLDISLAYAYRYTKHSQELVEYVIGTCPNKFNKGDKQIASTPITRKKRVTFMDPCETSTNNTLTHVKQHTINKTNEHVIPSTGVKGATAVSGSKPRSNIKKDRTLPAKSDMKKVKVHPRNNESSVKLKNHVDSIISYKRIVINSNSISVCKACNKCFMSVNHDKYVMKSVKSVKKPPVKKVWQIKQVVQIILWYLDSGCLKHMTGDCSPLRNFVNKFIGTDRFGNDYFGAIMGYGDYVIGDSMIFRVYYVE
nr:integrase, catalytic region, zinc finger, CCHC-type, peptidase aspartic, catalytic [Tanacetum cinerariifolium]